MPGDPSNAAICYYCDYSGQANPVVPAGYTVLAGPFSSQADAAAWVANNIPIPPAVVPCIVSQPPSTPVPAQPAVPAPTPSPPAVPPPPLPFGGPEPPTNPYSPGPPLPQPTCPPPCTPCAPVILPIVVPQGAPVPSSPYSPGVPTSPGSPSPNGTPPQPSQPPAQPGTPINLPQAIAQLCACLTAPRVRINSDYSWSYYSLMSDVPTDWQDVINEYIGVEEKAEEEDYPAEEVGAPPTGETNDRAPPVRNNPGPVQPSPSAGQLVDSGPGDNK